MTIPIQVSNYDDVDSAFARLDAHVRAEFEPLADAGRTLSVSSTKVDETTRRTTAFARLRRTDTYVVDAGGGRRAEVEFHWDGGSPQAFTWRVRELGPGADAAAPGCLGGAVVAISWVVLIVVKFDAIVEYRGRTLALALLGGLLAFIVTTSVAVGVVGALCERAVRRLRSAECRAASEFTARDVRPAAERAIASFLAGSAPKS